MYNHFEMFFGDCSNDMHWKNIFVFRDSLDFTNFPKIHKIYVQHQYQGFRLYSLKSVLFCFLGEMVIEYAGELIRSTLTDKRERYYDSRGIGCYMFKIDDNLVVDATMRGNAARFINHSCEVCVVELNF